MSYQWIPAEDLAPSLPADAPWGNPPLLPKVPLAFGDPPVQWEDSAPAPPFPPPLAPKPPIDGLTPRKSPSLNKLGRAPLSLDGPDEEWDYCINAAERVPLSQANILTSEALNRPGIHRFAIDIDLPVTAIPSTTPGHWHLYIDVDMTWEQYAAVLRALANAGVIEVGYARASLKRGYTSLRPPWVTKTDDERGNSH